MSQDEVLILKFLLTDGLSVSVIMVWSIVTRELEFWNDSVKRGTLVAKSFSPVLRA